MDTSQIIQTALLEWQPIRPDVAHGVYGRTLLAENLKVVLTRIEPGGMVGAHRDNFGHFFYFISGVGRVHLGDEQVEARAGLAARVAPGQAHAYANTSTEELVLISINIPSSGGGTEHQGEGNNLRRSLK